MIFNGKEKSYVTVLRGRERPAWASRERELSDGPKVKRITKNKTGTRNISVPVKIDHEGFSDLQKIKEDLAGWLVTDEPKPLEFKDDSGRVYFAVVDGEFDLDEFIYWGEGVINFICPDPFKYSHEKQLTAINTTSSTHVIEGHTSAPYRATTKFTSNASSYTFEFAQTGITSLRDINKIVVNYDFIAGDSLEINYSKRSILLNKKDISNALSIINSNYKEIPVGSVEFKATNPTDIIYKERYY